VSFAQFDHPTSNRYFEDYVAGSVYEFGPVDVSEEEIIGFARQYDPQFIHTDPDAAEKGPFHGLISSGWLTGCLLMRLFVDHYLTAVASLASPGIDELRWTAPVRPGDQLWLRVTVVDTRLSRSKPDRGVVNSFLEGRNAKGEVVMTMRAANFVGVRPKA
jgi:acyl dehydratase